MQLFDVRIVPEVEQDVRRLCLPESVNSAVSPQTTVSGVKGNREGTYRLITSFKLRCRSVTLPPCDRWAPGAKGTGRTFLKKFCDKSEQVAASGGLVRGRVGAGLMGGGSGLTYM